MPQPGDPLIDTRSTETKYKDLLKFLTSNSISLSQMINAIEFSNYETVPGGSLLNESNDWLGIKAFVEGVQARAPV